MSTPRLTRTRLRPQILQEERESRERRTKTARGRDDRPASVDAWDDMNATEEAKQAARAAGVSPDDVSGTGADGRITKPDVERAAAA